MVNEEAAMKSNVVQNDLQLMVIVAGGMSCDHLYVAGSGVAHLKAESSRAATGWHHVIWMPSRG